jgi:AbrB family looped-hinge helix DNA binding protein
MLYSWEKEANMAISSISTKGQITVPARMRKQLGIRPHDRVAIDVVKNAIVIKRAANIFDLRGFLGKGLPPEQERKRMRNAVARHAKGGT